jgi:hypothetical protein
MKRRFAALLVAAVALVLVTPAQAAGYHYVWKDVRWGSDSLAFYIPSGASIAIKNSSVITLPTNAYWPAPADSIPLFIAVGTISAAGAATDTLLLGTQWTYDGVNYIPALDWDTDDQVHVGTGLYFSYRFVTSSGAQPADAAAGAGRWAAGVPNTYAYGIPAKGAVGMRLVIHPSHVARTLNGKLSVRIGIPVSNEY